MDNRRWIRGLSAAVVVACLLIAGCSGDDGATVRNLAEDDGSSAEGSASNVDAGDGDGSSAEAGSSASASAPADGSSADDSGEPVEAEGGYTYASDVTAHRQVTRDVCEIKELLETPTPDFEAASAIYSDGEYSNNSDGSVRTLAGFAGSEDELHGFDTYYGTATPLDDWVTEALSGTGRFADTSDTVRAQAAEKGVQNQIMVAWTIHELNSAIEKAEAGEIDPDVGAPHNWDEAWAFYHGAAPDCAPYATANSRAGDFATLSDDGIAEVNETIVEAMNAGRDALITGDTQAASDSVDEIVRGVVITYSQATLRYATLVDDDVENGDIDEAAEHRIEGLAFFRVIEPLVADLGADVDTMNAVFDLEAEPGSNGGVDEVRSALTPAWNASRHLRRRHRHTPVARHRHPSGRLRHRRAVRCLRRPPEERPRPRPQFATVDGRTSPDPSASRRRRAWWLAPQAGTTAG